MPAKIDYDKPRLLELHSKGFLNIEIAEVMGVSHDTINRWLKKAGVESNRKPRLGNPGLKLEPLKDEIIHKYAAENMSTYEIADEYDAHRHTIGTALRKWGVPTGHIRNKEEIPLVKIPKTLRNIDRDELQELYNKYPSRKLAKILGYSHFRVQKAIKYHGITPRKNNH